MEKGTEKGNPDTHKLVERKDTKERTRNAARLTFVSVHPSAKGNETGTRLDIIYSSPGFIPIANGENLER
jgi:hypothetical protein